jgi:hypothetical protein
LKSGTPNQFDEGRDACKHDHQGDGAQAKANNQDKHAGEHEKHENCPKHQLTSFDALAGRCPCMYAHYDYDVFRWQKMVTIDHFFDSGIRMLEFVASAKLLQFMHIVNSATKTLVESHCVSCGRLIAAAPRRACLQIAESAHRCLARGKPSRGVGVKQLGAGSAA